MSWRPTILWGLTTFLCVGILPDVRRVPVAHAASNELRAGASRETFTLPPSVPLAGYSRRKGKPSQGRHDPVGVRALVMQEGTTTAALVSCDLLIVDERLFDAVRVRLAAAGLPSDILLLVAATHTHSGPGAYGARFVEKISMGHFDPEVFEAIAGSIAHAIRAAYAQLSPAQVAFHSSLTDGLIKNRLEAGGETDAEVTVFAVYRHGEEEPLGVVVGFAAHPTTLGAWNRQLSADYPGIIAREVERRFPSSACLFFAGAVGDQAPVKQGSGFEPAERLGAELAARAITLLEQGTPHPAASLRGLQDMLPLPPARVRINRLALPRWLGARFVDDDAHLSLLVVGKTVFVGVPCDLTTSLGGQLKTAARTHGFDPVIVGFANDYIGYCVPEALYEQRQYESSMAFNGPRTGELVVERLKVMIGRIATSDKQQATREP